MNKLSIYIRVMCEKIFKRMFCPLSSSNSSASCCVFIYPVHSRAVLFAGKAHLGNQETQLPASQSLGE